MKNIAITLLLSFVVFPLMAQKKAVRDLSSFSDIVIYGDVKLELYKGDKEKAEISASGTELENVITDVSGKKLKIKLKSDIFKDKEVRVKVYYTNLEKIKAFAGAEVRFKDDLKAKHLIIHAKSAAKVRGNVDLYSLDVKVSQGGVINIKGKAETQNIHAGTGGTYDAYDLITNDAIVEAYTGGIVKVNTTKMINAFASSGADISFMGNPGVKSRKSNLGGKIEDISKAEKM